MPGWTSSTTKTFLITIYNMWYNYGKPLWLVGIILAIYTLSFTRAFFGQSELPAPQVTNKFQAVVLGGFSAITNNQGRPGFLGIRYTGAI